MNIKNNIYIINTAFPYINGNLHLGHIMEFIQADIYVRFLKMNKKKVYFIGANDIHGNLINLNFLNKKIIKKNINLILNKRKKNLNYFNIIYNNWYNTNSIENNLFSNLIYYIFYKNKLLIKKKVYQFFDNNKNIYLTDRFIKGICPKCLFKNQYGDFCENCNINYDSIYIKNPNFILNNKKPLIKLSKQIFLNIKNKIFYKIINEILNKKYQKEINKKKREWYNLNIWNISRNKPYFGIKIFNKKNKYFYVWWDAIIGYLSCFKNLIKNNKKFKNIIYKNKNIKQTYFIGKDIVYFHIIILQIILKIFKYKTKNKFFIHGFLKINKEKMSKTKKNYILISKYIKLNLNPEYLRYYFASKLNNKIKDINFNIKDFIYKINNELINKYINIISRIIKFIKKNKFIINNNWNKSNKVFLKNIINISLKIKKLYKKIEYNKIIKIIINKIQIINNYINYYKLWNINNKKKKYFLSSFFIECFKNITIFLKPILPEINYKLEFLLNINLSKWNNIYKKIKNKKIKKYFYFLNKINIIKKI
ncbi:putative methionyl-tRNA synthetase [Candidatus Zinderia insecticola CARI]|uniref:methionine--tRNA ligase n=1 Tax=Zinderia insecticola (strain CARI) TaxID=871271 RepID=E0TIR5_ZINIC|nr:putative methionyl-tRNA synthetase [Candidatus Zinderia insecticola CARI]